MRYEVEQHKGLIAVVDNTIRDVTAVPLPDATTPGVVWFRDKIPVYYLALQDAYREANRLNTAV